MSDSSTVRTRTASKLWLLRLRQGSRGPRSHSEVFSISTLGSISNSREFPPYPDTLDWTTTTPRLVKANRMDRVSESVVLLDRERLPVLTN
jgi:hypothetical protein